MVSGKTKRKTSGHYFSSHGLLFVKLDSHRRSFRICLSEPFCDLSRSRRDTLPGFSGIVSRSSISSVFDVISNPCVCLSVS